jgi:hypothetical protein
MPVIRTSFDQVPVELAKKVAEREMMMPATMVPTSCAVCGNPVDLENCKTDERGKAVHQKCYVAKVVKKAKSKVGKSRTK